MNSKQAFASLLFIVSIILVGASFMVSSALVETMFESLSLCGALCSFHLFSSHASREEKKA